MVDIPNPDVNTVKDLEVYIPQLIELIFTVVEDNQI